MNSGAPQPVVVPASSIAAMFVALGELLDLLRDIDDLFDSADFDSYARGIQNRLLPCLEAFDARSWVEHHLTAEDYEAEFGAVEEDGSQVVLGVRVSAVAKAALARKASETGRTQSEIVEELLLSL